MKIIFLEVGKTVNADLKRMIDDYASRLSHYTKFQTKDIPELKSTKNLTEQQQKTLEGQLILSNVNQSDFLVLLDERGKQYRSLDFASQMEKWMNQGRDIIFLVGGPYGFSEEVYNRANALISLSIMTFSHQMIRLLFVEQLYRAFTILNNEPYHHE
ncbi:MAG: 23S rRNA (pseudouridine(1915)-N(3))-methyltransferase RlmH [Paludibacteraceae bacterium]|nr:23S rRNA (pseudouridine(1915)-N(3))-methyltransferase RlmH [Paludibacteraceae bacterium]